MNLVRASRLRARQVLRRVHLPRTPSDWLAAAVVAAVALYFAFIATRAATLWLLAHWPVLPAAGCFAIGVAVLVAGRRAAVARERAARLAELRFSLAELDALDPTAFEFALRDLLIRDGCTAEQVGGANDHAADVLARTPRGLRLVLQAKHTRTGARVPSKVVFEVNGTARTFHGADAAVIVTNGGFTLNARKAAAHAGIHLVDRALLHTWATSGITLPDLLRLPC